MKSKIQKKLAGRIAKKSPKKISLDDSRREEIKEAITRADIKALMKDDAIKVKKDKGVSRARARKHQKQKSKGRRKGQGKRKGSANARESGKKTWMNSIRSQRKLLKELKDNENITAKIYKELYRKAKGGFFRSKRHIKLYITEHKLAKKKK